MTTMNGAVADSNYRRSGYASAFYLTLVSIIIGVTSPIQANFQPQIINTLALLAAGLAILFGGVLRGKAGLYYAGAAVLIATIGFCLASQPTQLGVSDSWVWPLRLLFFLVVVGGWLAQLRLPQQARRALGVAALPILLLLLCAGGPSLTSHFFGWRLDQAANFQPYWLAADSQGTVYATNAAGNFIWVISSSGSPRGTLWPLSAAADGQSGPGIIPLGYPTPVAKATIALTLVIQPLATVTPVPIAAAAAAVAATSPLLTFCGIAVGPADQLYIADDMHQELLSFSPGGTTMTRHKLPNGYLPTKGCLAADEQYIYLLSRPALVWVFDPSGGLVKAITLPFLPTGISSDHRGNLVALQPRNINVINVASEAITSYALPPTSRQLRTGYGAVLVSRGNELLTTSPADNKIVRLSPESGALLGSIGSAGTSPGHFSGMAGLAEDKAGRIYVADWRFGVIQRFTPDGKIDAVWSARGEPQPTPLLEDD